LVGKSRRDLALVAAGGAALRLLSTGRRGEHKFAVVRGLESHGEPHVNFPWKIVISVEKSILVFSK
jgi:hypothetical protein